MTKICKRHKRGKPAMFRPGWYCARCPAFIETEKDRKRRQYVSRSVDAKE